MLKRISAILLIFLLSCSHNKTETPINIKLNEFNGGIEQSIYIPNLKSEKYEVVYWESKESFNYEIYCWDEIKVIFRQEHEKSKHAHSIHDLLFTFEKSKKIVPIDLKELAKEYHIDLSDVKSVNEVRIYGGRLLEYNTNHYKLHWLIDINNIKTPEEYKQDLNGIIKFFKENRIQESEVKIIDLERNLYVEMWITIGVWHYKMTFHINKIKDLPVFFKNIGVISK